jgi:hypothetical protein
MERGINPEGYKVCKYILKVRRFIQDLASFFSLFLSKRHPGQPPLQTQIADEESDEESDEEGE